MRVFWAQGYGATSVDTLCREMQMPRASLYKMYGDKEGLFLETLKHYGEIRFAPVRQLLEGGGDIHADLSAFFTGVIDFATCDPKTPGCLIAGTLADTAGADMNMRARLTVEFSRVEKALKARLERAQDDGQISATPGAGNLAWMLAATARGLMIRTRTGCSPRELYPAAQACVDLCCRT